MVAGGVTYCSWLCGSETNAVAVGAELNHLAIQYGVKPTGAVLGWSWGCV